MDYTKIVKVLSLAATGNSIDAALDEMSKKELEYLLELCQEEKARRQAGRAGARRAAGGTGTGTVHECTAARRCE